MSRVQIPVVPLHFFLPNRLRHNVIRYSVEDEHDAEREDAVEECAFDEVLSEFVLFVCLVAAVLDAVGECC